MNLSWIAIAIYKYRKMLNGKKTCEQENAVYAYRNLICRHFDKLSAHDKQRVLSMAESITE